MHRTHAIMLTALRTQASPGTGQNACGKARRFLCRALLIACGSLPVACGGSDGMPIGSATVQGSGTSGSPASTGEGTAAGDETIAALFEAPPNSDVTPGSLFGLWGGTDRKLDTSFDLRYRFAPKEMLHALKCTNTSGNSVVASVVAAARITESEIAILESKTDSEAMGDLRCTIEAAPMTVKPCSDDGLKRSCFELSGTEMKFYGKSALDVVSLTKLSD